MTNVAGDKSNVLMMNLIDRVMMGTVDGGVVGFDNDKGI